MRDLRHLVEQFWASSSLLYLLNLFANDLQLTLFDNGEYHFDDIMVHFQLLLYLLLEFLRHLVSSKVDFGQATVVLQSVFKNVEFELIFY